MLVLWRVKTLNILFVLYVLVLFCCSGEKYWIHRSFQVNIQASGRWVAMLRSCLLFFERKGSVSKTLVVINLQNLRIQKESLIGVASRLRESTHLDGYNLSKWYWQLSWFISLSIMDGMKLVKFTSLFLEVPLKSYRLVT